MKPTTPGIHRHIIISGLAVLLVFAAAVLWACQVPLGLSDDSLAIYISIMLAGAAGLFLLLAAKRGKRPEPTEKKRIKIYRETQEID